ALAVNASTRASAQRVAQKQRLDPVEVADGGTQTTTDGQTPVFLETQSDCMDALKRAADLAGHDQRVFLAEANRQTSVLVDRAHLEQHSYQGQRPQGTFAGARRTKVAIVSPSPTTHQRHWGTSTSSAPPKAVVK